MGDKAPDVPLDQVEWRVQGTPANGSVSVVAYLDAPTVAGLLDDWVGPARWADTYEPMGNGEKALWCHLSVKFENEWVTKVDLGVPSNMEAAKGLVSDAFKRVAMRKWGVGRNVFDLPILRIKKFRQYQRNGKDQAALTGESAVEIQQRLTALGFEDAARQTKVAADDVEGSEGGAGPDPVKDAPPSANVDLSKLEALIVTAQDAGLDLDWDKSRAYAGQSQAHADKAVGQLKAKLAEAEGVTS